MTLLATKSMQDLTHRSSDWTHARVGGIILDMQRLSFMPAVNWLTIISFLVALTASVFATAHTPDIEPQLADQPCHGQEAPVAEGRWTVICESLCSSADLQVMPAPSPDRLDTLSKAVDIVTYTTQSPKTVKIGVLSLSAHAHDPPGSDIYLTTQRFRI